MLQPRVLIGLVSSSVKQTSVRLLPAAVKALNKLCAERDSSRDRAISDLLDSYVEGQLALDPGNRLTHISAVLRYPPLPAGRNRPDGKVRVPVRLRPGVAEAVEDVTLKLPGQTRRRGLKDYARSPLSEAIYTALSRAYPWHIPGLEELPAIWTQDAAVGLWRLTIAATLTKPEQCAVLGDLDQLDVVGERQTALSELLRHGDLAWHHPWRDSVALSLARNLLTGTDPGDSMRSLHRQDAAFETLRFDLERTEDLDHPVLNGAPKAPSCDVTGRGGTLVWRGRRRLALRQVGEWIAWGPSAPLVVSPPRVRLRHPTGWFGVRVGAGEHLPQSAARDVESRRVLLVEAEDTATAWPYSCATGKPVPRFDLVLETLSARSAEEIVEMVLLDDLRHRTVYLLADEAHAVGLINASERDSLISAAATTTKSRMATIIKRAAAWAPKEQAELMASETNPERFFEIAAKHGHRGAIARPWWPWEAGPTVRELEEQRFTRDQIRKLVERRGLYWKRDLEREMEMAGRAAAAGSRVEVDDLTNLVEGDAEWGVNTANDLDEFVD